MEGCSAIKVGLNSEVIRTNGKKIKVDKKRRETPLSDVQDDREMVARMER